MIARVGTIAGAVLAGALALAGPATAANAATDRVLLSLDGSHFATTLTQELFSSTLVPGQTSTVRLYVQNDSDVPATIAVTARNATSGTAEFLPVLELGAASGSAGSTVGLDDATSCAVLLDSPVVAAGATLPVRLTLGMGDVDGDTAKNDTATFDLVVTLTEATTATAPAACATAPAGTPSSGSGSSSSTTVTNATTRGTVYPRHSASDSDGDGDQSGAQAAPAAGSGRDTDEQIDTLALHDERVDPNTYSFGITGILILVGAGAVGWFLLAGRRRRGREDTPS